jgi:flavin reductase (DIM6/NTAB) family NADH-FMN oxidoreductase RutF
MADDGELIGATVSSFNSVSLDPPLILFSIARSAKAFPAWQRVEGFAVNFLGEDQSALSTRFARALADKWKGIRPLRGVATNAPLLPDALASLECRPYAQYDGGDHVIFVGQVLSLQLRSIPDPRPLVFFGSRYRRLDPERQIETPFDADLWLHGW